MKKTMADAVRHDPSQKGFDFRKKPVVIQAAFFDGDLVGLRDANGNVQPRTCPTWFPAATRVVDGRPAELKPGHVVTCDGSLFIGTLEGTMEAKAGDWIIRGVKGEIYPCKPEIFAATYDPA